MDSLPPFARMIERRLTLIKGLSSPRLEFMAALLRSRWIIYAKRELAMSIPHTNRVKEIQAVPQLLETLYYERQSTRLVQQGLHVAHASCEHRVVARNQVAG
ncbi:hypothetical protein T09_4849 [Trichinella sp. T9]|nr:hypothetical protein T09_4849 [Trichinella sp. T9]